MKLELIFILLFISCVFVGCHSTKFVPVETYVYKTDTVKELTYLRDSINVFRDKEIYRYGDTVYLKEYTTKYVQQIKRDSIYINHTDSIYREVPIIPSGYKLTTKLDKALSASGWLLWGILFATMCFFIYKVFRR
jgi:hypothetical protein